MLFDRLLGKKSKRRASQATARRRYRRELLGEKLEDRRVLSHYRGGSVSNDVSATGIIHLEVYHAWRSDFVASASFGLYTGPGGTGTFRGNFTSTGLTNVATGTEQGGAPFTVRNEDFTFNAAAAGLTAGTYYARWTNCCRVAGINNAPEDSWALETKIVYQPGVANAGPTILPATVDVIAKGFEYRQNLDSRDPDGTPVNFSFITGSTSPNFGPTTAIPGISLDSLGNVGISAANTAALANGRWIYKATVTDGSGATAQRDVLLVAQTTAGNNANAPVLAPIGPKTIAVGTPLSFTVSATDADAGQLLRLRSQLLPLGATFSPVTGNPATQTFTWTPTAGQEGTYQINFEAYDNAVTPIIDSELVTITVTGANTAPTLDPVGNKVVANGDTLSFTLSGADPDAGQNLTYSAFFLPAGATFDPVTRTFTWTPSAAQYNNVFTGITFRATDDGSPNLHDEEAINITVGTGNVAPVVNQVMNTTLFTGVHSHLNITATDTSPGQTITLSAVSLPAGASFTTATGNSSVTQQLHWTPTAADVGTHVLTFRAEDNGAPILSSQMSFTITVQDVGPITVDHTHGGNLRLRKNGSMLEVYDETDATVIASRPLSNTTEVIIAGDDAPSDTLVVDYAFGGYFNVPISFDGGAGANDKLLVIGAPDATTALYTPSPTTFGNGTVTINGTSAITFTGLEPVDITGFATATVASPANPANALNVAGGFDSNTGLTPAIVVTGNTGLGMTGIESAHLYGNTSVVLDTSATTGAGVNTITVSGAIPLGHGNTNLTLKTNANGSVAVNAALNIAGALSVQTPLAHVNAVINATSITGTATTVNVDDPGQIQDGVDMAAAGATVNVAAGLYVEDVNLNKAGLKLLGAGPAASTIRGVIGGPDGATVRVAANNVEVAGFTITREGNTVADWNNPGLNSAGIAIIGTGLTGMLVHDNRITGNRSAIDINNTSGHTVRNNVIDDNHTGVIFRNQTNNITFTENAVTNNRTVGVLFLDASGGTNVPLQQALASNFTNNNISGNWYGQIVDRQSGGALPAPGTTNLKNFSGNWLGTASPVITTANSTEPGYAVHIPVAYGGTAVNPGGQPDVAGPGSANFDITPLLESGVDTDIETTPGRGTYGFQGSFAALTATSQLAQTGATGRITEAINLAPHFGVVHVTAGTFNERLVINKEGLDVIGAGIDVTIVDHTGTGGFFNSGVQVTRDDVLLKSLTVTGNPLSSAPRYGIKADYLEGSAVTPVDGLVIDTVKVTNSFRTGLDLNGVTNTTVNNFFAINNGGAGIFMTDVKGAALSNITTSGNPWTGVSIATRGQFFPIGVTGVVFSGTNSFAESAGKNGGMQLEMSNFATPASPFPISWSNDLADGANVTILPADFTHALGGHAFDTADRYLRFYNTLAQAQAAAAIHPGGPDHYLGHSRYIQQADDSNGLPGSGPTQFYVYDNAANTMSIQAAIDASVNGDKINVFNGTYVENVIVNKQVEIAGESEAGVIVMPALADPAVNANSVTASISAGSSNVFLIRAHNVHIHDLTVDGDNPALTSGIIRGGQDIDARNGIITDHTVGLFNNLTVQDVTVKNIYLRGIYASSGGSFLFDDNTVQNVRGSGGSIAMFNFGGGGIYSNNFVTDANDGIASNHSRGTHYLNNVVTNSSSGIHSDNYGSGGVATGELMQGNRVEDGSLAGGSYGIWTFAPYSAITVHDNEVINVDVGLGAFGAFGGVTTFTLNDVDLENRPGSLGAYISTTLFSFGSTNISATLTNDNTITNAGTGIYVEQETGFTATVNITNNSASIHGNVIGIDVNGGSATIAGNHIYDNTTGVRFRNGANGSVSGNDFNDAVDNDTDVRLDSNAGTVTVGVNNFAGETYYIDNRDSAAQNIIGSTFDQASNFRIEDRMYHALDSTASGLVTWVANNRYVTTPGTGASDETIQRAVDAAAAGDTINIEAGTFVEDVIINKRLHVLGAGSGVAGTIIDGTGNAAVELRTGGTSAANRMVLEGLRLTDAARRLWITNPGASFLTIDDVAMIHTGVGFNGGGLVFEGNTVSNDVFITDMVISGAADGIRVRSTAKIDGMILQNSQIEGNNIGIFTVADIARTDGHNDFKNIQFNNSSFSNNALKGIYLEKADYIVFNNLVVNNSGTAGGFATGVDVNLKFGTYNSVVFNNATITNSGTGDAVNGAGLWIKARGTGAETNLDYVGNPATLASAEINGGTFSGNTVAIRSGEPGKANLQPANISVDGAALSGNVRGIIIEHGVHAGLFELANTSITGTTNAALFVSGIGTVTLDNNTISGNGSGGTIQNVATVNLLTRSVADVLDLNHAVDNTFTTSTTQSIGFSGVTTFNADARGGDDVVNVKAHPTTTFNLTGNANSTASPGDTLNYVTDGTPFGWGPAKITTLGKADINFNTFETYNNVGNVVSILGTGDDDILEVIATNRDSGTYQLTSNGVPGPVVAFTGMASLAFAGLAGSDKLIIHHPTGDAFNRHTVFDGGTSPGDNDVLEIHDGDFAVINNTFTGPASGEIFMDPPADDAFTVLYANLEPVLLNVGTVNAMIFNLPAGADAAIVEDDGVAANDMSQIRALGGTFETTVFTHPFGALTINGGAGDSLEYATTDAFATANINTAGADSVSITSLVTGGNANWSATNSISQTGAFTVTGNITLTTTGPLAPITLFNSGNQIGGEITLTSTGDADLRDSLGAMVFYLTDVGGDLNVRSDGGNIQQTGVFFVIDGNSSFTTTGLNDDIILDNLAPTNDFVGAVSLFTNGPSGNASISDRNTLNLGTSNVGGTLLAIAQAGNLVSSGTATAGGTVTLQASAAITDGNGATVNVVAPTLNASAATGIDLDTSIATLIANNTVSGSILISEANAITLQNVVNNNAQITITTAAAGTVTAENVNAGTGNVMITVANGNLVSDGDAAADIVGNLLDLRVSAAGNRMGLSTAARLQINAVTLQANNSVAGTNFAYIVDMAGGLTMNNSSIGAGVGTTFDLLVLNGSLLSAPPPTTRDVGATIIVLEVTGAGSTIGTAAVPFEINSPTATAGASVTATSAGGDILLRDLADSFPVNVINANGGNVSLQSTVGALLDVNGGANNIIANGARLLAVTGIGSADALETTINVLSANNTTSGNIRVDNASGGLLTVGTVFGTSGVNNLGPGQVVITNASPITFAANSSSGGDFTAIASESAASNFDNLTINSGVTVASTAGNVLLQAGDNFSLPAGSRVVALAATKTVTLESIDTAADPEGSIFDFFGDADSNNIFFLGSNTEDTFNIQIDDDTHMNVDGMLPSFPTLPGDVLNIFGANLTLTVTGVGAGTWTVAGSPGLDYIEIETVTASGPYHLVVNMGAPGLVPFNSVDAQLDGTNSELEIRVDTDDDARDGSLAFNGDVLDIRSLTILGSNAGEVFSITQNANNLLPGETGGLNNSSPLGQPLNASFLFAGRTPSVPNPPAIHFTGNGGPDELDLYLNLAENVGYFADSIGGAGSGDINVQGKLTASFNTIERVDVNQFALGGSMIVDSSSFSPLTTMIITDIGTATQVDGDAGFADAEFQNAASVTIRSGLGRETIELVSIDSAGLASVLLDSDTIQNSDVNAPNTADNSADDTIRIHSLPLNVPALALGGAGRDLFQLFNSANTVDGILGPVTINGEDGNVLHTSPAFADNDRLVIVDTGDMSGDTVVVTETTVEGLTGYAAGIDVTYSNIDHIDVTATSGNDTITYNMDNGLTDINTATIRGGDGQDLFHAAGVENYVATNPNPLLQLPKFSTLFLFGDGPNDNTQGDIFGATDATRIRPSASVVIDIDGGVPSVVAPPGNLPGDRLNLDMKEGGTPLTPDVLSPVIATQKIPVVVDTIGGTATSASHTIIRFREIEFFDVTDKDEQTNVQRGDLYVRASELADRITLFPDIRYTFPNGPVKIRYNNVDLGPFDQINASVTSPGRWIVYARDGHDQVTVNNTLRRNTELFGQHGNDYLVGSANGGGMDLLVGGSGNDRLQGLLHDDIIWGDKRPLGPETPTDTGPDGIDQLHGGHGNDLIDAGGNNDKAYGQDGDDIVRGGDGNDTLGGDKGYDIVLGGAGNDKINGGYERDILIGGLGVDNVDGDQEEDIVIGDASTWDTHTDAYDANDTALLALMFGPGGDFWRSGNTYAVRTANGSHLHNQLTANIIDDTSIDTIVGDLALDWYWDVGTKNDKYSGRVAATEKLN